MDIPFITLRDRACDEAYRIFDEKVRELPKNPDGSIRVTAAFHDNDIDAFRHAYVSGVMTQEYGEKIADILGQLNELFSSLSRSSNNQGSTNMDLWNNAIGRKYGLNKRTRENLAKALLDALSNGELITTPGDERKYESSFIFDQTESKPVIVLRESDTGRNEEFFDTIKKLPMNREEFVTKINAGEYPGYRVASINGTLTPISKGDNDEGNNLG